MGENLLLQTDLDLFLWYPMDSHRFPQLYLKPGAANQAIPSASYPWWGTLLLPVCLQQGSTSSGLL